MSEEDTQLSDWPQEKDREVVETILADDLADHLADVVVRKCEIPNGPYGPDCPYNENQCPECLDFERQGMIEEVLEYVKNMVLCAPYHDEDDWLFDCREIATDIVDRCMKLPKP